ncbi:methylamine utilization protein [Aquabacterium sp. J223]|uniref:methylamine utilization protein n=1 Tax=Aquabacterium sp. J223 TaxID=2898431 RepID=UPI0021AD6F5F|nr:methylamine utilization protein [Aquabacterium sp. J223]UUX96919.1 methylamine utilization protein [Aquabacterium sp. J223]
MLSRSTLPLCRLALSVPFALSAGACAPAGAVELVVAVSDAAGRALPDAVVAAVARGGRTAAAPGTSAQLAQRDRQFQPQVLVVQAGTAVHFPNFDTVRHHVYSVSPTKRFELKLYAGTPAQPVVFERAGVAVLGCNIHDRMAAWLAVVDTPHFALTGATGQASLDLPPGAYRLQLWHVGMGEEAGWTEQAVTVGGAPMRLQVTLAGGGPRP